MSVEVRPLGVKCNIQCKYCYQNPQRESGNIIHKYDLDRLLPAIEQSVEETGESSFCIFGGEPLLATVESLVELWRWGFQKYGYSEIQTNGTLISERHIELFKEFNVKVGISIDGPDSLNDARWHHDLAKTRDSTRKVEAAIQRLCEEGLYPSLITTLSRCNATAEHLPTMMDWFRELEQMGVRHVRLHELEVDNADVGLQFSLTEQENIAAFKAFYALEKSLEFLRFDVFAEMKNLLLGKDEGATCVWKACDPLTTRAVRGIEGNGQISNCGRTNKEGIDFVKSDQPGYERYVALYQTPQENGGCKECRFFLMCKGQCPGTAMDSDWRNRTDFCGLWKAMFSHLEQELLQDGGFPLSLAPYRKTVEEKMVRYWADGSNPSIESVLVEVFKG